MSSRSITRILIIYTGGTIGMTREAGSETLVPMGFRELRAHIPEISKLHCDFDMFSFSPPIDSSNMSPAIWIQLAELIYDKYEAYDGFVILHGSDTMAFTASALSFMLDHLAKPVILTGSQLPIGEIRTDAKENIITAMEIASAQKNGRAMVPEVCIYFDYSLFRGNRTKKYNTESFEAFRSVNFPPLAEAGIHIRYSEQNILPHPTAPFRIFTRLDPNISVLKLFPGIPPTVVNAVLQAPGIRAVIMESFGSGNTSTEPWFIDCLTAALGRGVVLLDRTQCDGGSVTLGRYETSAHLKKIGVTDGNDLTFETAVAKLMFLLGQDLSLERIKELLETSLKGELTENKALRFT